MLNIAESVPAQESIPPIPELNQTKLHPIPESILTIPSDSGIAEWNRIIIESLRDNRIIIEVVIPELDGIPCDSGIAGIGSDSGIPFCPHPHFWYCV